MRHTPNLKLDRYRVRHPNMPEIPIEAGANWGYFEIETPKGKLRILSSDGIVQDHDNSGWEHVSVSLAGRCPTWQEMCLVKELFWRDDETVVQFHPVKASYVSYHDFVLHMWRHRTLEFPTPPSILVGPKSAADYALLRQEIAEGRYPNFGHIPERT